MDDEIEPYDLNLNNTSKNYQYKWEVSILKELNKNHDLRKDYFYFLAGNTYSKNISKYIIHTCNSVKGMSIGQQLHFYKIMLEE